MKEDPFSLLQRKRASHFWLAPRSYMNHIGLEGDVSIENHGTVRACIIPRLAKCAWCTDCGCTRGIGANAVEVLIVDVQPRYAQVLVIESVEHIGAQLQVHALFESEVLSYCQVQLVAGHGARDVTTDCAAE